MKKIQTTYDRCLDMIIEVKERDGITLKELGSLVGCTPDDVSRYINKRKWMPADIMFALLQALGYRIIVTRRNEHDV